MVILISVFSLRYHGKTVDFERYSPCHRTTAAHFLNKGKWDDATLEDILKSTIIQFIYQEAQRSGNQSHLKGSQDYGHQAVAVMLSCNDIVLNYAVVLYDKSKSKIIIVQDIADELPVPLVVSCFLCDSWYTCGNLMDASVKKGFYTIGALKEL